MARNGPAMRSIACLRSSFDSHLSFNFSSSFLKPKVTCSGLFCARNHTLSTLWRNDFTARADSTASHGCFLRRSSSHSHGPYVSGDLTPKTEDQDFVDRHEKAQGFYNQVQRALLRRDHQELIQSFQAVGQDVDLIRSIPDNTFTEVLALLQPKAALAWVKPLYPHLSPALVEQLRLPSADNLVRGHLSEAVRILDRRHTAGKSLSVADYSNLLGFARWTGLKNVAVTFWKSMQDDMVKPNLKCYNNYLGAIVSNLHLDPQVRHSRHLTPFRIKERLNSNSSAKFAAYKFGAGGIKQDVLSLHDDMKKDEIVPDEETFRLLILGVAREGDIATVKKILRQVWNVDVDTIMDGSAEQLERPSLRLEPTSPLWPSPFLLYSIAHAFGINNDIPTALRIVDHVSQRFNVEIFDYVWRELFNWTFVLSLPRRASKGERAHLPKSSVQKIWNVLQNEPYNVQPTLDMYNKLIKSLFVQQRTREMWQYMCEALPLYQKIRKETREKYQNLQSALQISRTRPRNTAPVARLHQKHMHSELAQKTARLWLKRWIRLLLGSMRTWHKVDKDLFWSTVQIPRIVLQWNEFMPSKVCYHIPGGRVSIVLRTTQDKVEFQEKVKGVLETRDHGLGKHETLFSQCMENQFVPTRRMGRAMRRRQQDVDHLDETVTGGSDC